MSFKDGKIVLDIETVKQNLLVAIPIVLFFAAWGFWAEKEDYKDKLFLARHPPNPALIVRLAPDQECLWQRSTKYGSHCARYGPPRGWTVQRFEQHCNAIWSDVQRRLQGDTFLELEAMREYGILCDRPKK